MADLTPNQLRFCREYAACRNGVQAYLRAFGPTLADGRPRSYHGARTAASRLLADVDIQSEIDAADREHRRGCRVAAGRTLRELAAVAHADPGDLFIEGDDGSPVLRDWSTIDAAARKAVKSVKVRRKRKVDEQSREWEEESVTIQFHSKLPALEKLGRHLGLFSTTDAINQLLDRLDGEAANPPN